MSTRTRKSKKETKRETPVAGPRPVEELPVEKPSTQMTFSEALERAKLGYRIARAGWNGKGMWVAYTGGLRIPAQIAAKSGAIAHLVAELADAKADQPTIVTRPRLDMKCADGTLQIGWLASQTDLLACDWSVL